MRQIKFRGLRLDKSGMVFGDLIHGVGAKSGKLFILPAQVNLAYIKDCHPLDGVEIVPESVGQFTGLLDKNGKEIYEGDIYKSWYSRDASGEDIITIIEDVKYEVEPERGFACYSILFLQNAEIIGNIYENPELIKQQTTTT